MYSNSNSSLGAGVKVIYSTFIKSLKQTVKLYSSQRDNAELDPHIYSIANNCFTNMVQFGKDQSIIVTGESGAGKTVSAKFSMKYFAAVGGTSAAANNKGIVFSTFFFIFWQKMLVGAE